MFGASDGLTRTPSPGNCARFDVRIVIQPLPDVLLGSLNVPVYVAPAWSTIVSPRCALLMALVSPAPSAGLKTVSSRRGSSASMRDDGTRRRESAIGIIIP